MRGDHIAFAAFEAGHQLMDFVAIGQFGGGAGAGGFGDRCEERVAVDGFVAAGKHFGNASGEALHQCEGGVGAEAIALVNVEGIDGADQREIAVADQFHQGQAGAQMLAGDADDQTKIGLDDAVFRLGDAAADFFQPAEVARAGELRVDLAAGGHELEFVEIQLEEESPFAAAGEQGGAVEILQISRQIAGNASILGAALGG